MFKWLACLAVVLALGWLGSTAKLGNHTLFGHFRRIWSTEETQDLIQGTREATAPALDRVKRGVKVGLKEAARTGSEPDAAVEHPSGE
ncbi:MAG: hypothetical protein HY698_03130 [Deltaproteobacteria bacterium]|nr:hypothetical protein [Deltaproteobacteria bacterium]